MNKRKRSTKRALLTSVLSLFLCFAMLLGTTFAWFTDSVSSANNIITSGNLDVELYYQAEGQTGWTKVTDKTNVFKDALWEPGHTEVVKLKVVNEGTLALKYQLGINVASETTGINVDNEPFKLSDYIMYGVADGAKDFADRDAAINEVKADATKLNVAYSKSSNLLATEEAIVTMVVYMPTTVGNEANAKKGTAAPTINLGINLFATQYTSESDSFGKDYDKDAAWTGAVDTSWYNTTDTEFTLVTAEQLAGLAKIVNEGTDTFEGKTVKLGADIDLRNVNWTPIGTRESQSTKFKGTFIGTGYTISNLRVVGSKAVGLFGSTFSGAHIEGVTVDKAYVSGNDYVGVILGAGYLGHNCIKNCTVTNATVIAAPYKLANGNYDGGAKAGGIAGQAYNGNITGCTVKNTTVMAYRDLGAIAGMLDFDGSATVEASGNTVENVKLSYVAVSGKYDDGKQNQNMSEVVGRVGANATVGANTVTNVTMNEDNKGAMMITTLDELIAFANDVNSGNSYDEMTVLLGADIDLNNMEWTPIGNSTNKFSGVFDGNGYTISNLKITGNKSHAGFFGYTNDGNKEASVIRNLTIENANVSGYTCVGVVAGTPYTTEYSNITVKGHVEVNGMSYVGAVGGKNAYADWTNITVDVDETSYVKAISTENGKDYRTYVGGVIGFMGEGAHTVSNVKSNIDVIGDVCDVGGIVGIAHYGNTFQNVVCTGDVTIIDSTETAESEEIGGIAGVWHNKTGNTVTFIDCEFTGKLTVNFTDGVDLSDNTIAGKAYSSSEKGELIIINYLVDNDQKVTYTVHTGTNKKVILSKIAADAPAKIVIPEGVTHLGGKVLNGNTSVKEVVIHSTVTDFGGTPNDTGTGASGGMFYNSAVEKVTLPEGITEIPAATFNQAANLKEVNIPSSVKTIGINAFAGSGLETLEIPATVEEIGYGAFRDMDSLTTVTIEGDVNIPHFAFRDCSALKNVYLKGVNVTFTNGNMIFCVTSTNNENPNGITVHVRNNTVKARLEATGHFKGTIVVTDTVDENGVTTDENGNKYGFADNATELSTVINGGAKTVYLGSGNYVIPSAAKSKTLTIVGNGDTNVAVTKDGVGGENCDYGFDGSNVVFENIVITTNSSTYIGYARLNATYNNCTINGTYTLYGNSTFNDCTFNVSGDVYNIWTWGAPEATFNNCTFNSDGKAMLLYGTVNTKLTMNGCTFNDNGGLTDKKAAIEIGNDYNKSYTLVVNNTKVNGYEINDKGTCTNTTLWGNKNSMTDNNLKVFIDGVSIWLGTVPASKPASLDVDTASKLISINDAAAFAYLNTLLNDSNFTANYGSKWQYRVELNCNIDLMNNEWTPIIMSNFVGFDGKGYTISNLKVTSGADKVGLFGSLGGNDLSSYYIKNLTIDGAYVKGGNYAGALLGSGNCIAENVTVLDAKVEAGKYVGGLAGRVSSIKNCTIKGSTVVASNKTVGGLVGYCITDPGIGYAINNKVENVTVTGAYNVGGMFGQAQNVNVDGNTVKNVTVISTTALPADASSNEVRTAELAARSAFANTTIGANTVENVKTVNQ